MILRNEAMESPMDTLQYLLSMEPTYIPTDRALGFVSTDGPGEGQWRMSGPREGEMSPEMQRLLRRMRGGAVAGVYTD